MHQTPPGVRNTDSFSPEAGTEAGIPTATISTEFWMAVSTVCSKAGERGWSQKTWEKGQLKSLFWFTCVHEKLLELLVYSTPSY